MRGRANVQDLDELLSDGPISQRAVLNIIHRHNGSTDNEIAYANSLLPDAGDYLSGMWWLRAFIKAEISDDDAKREIERQRRIIKRLCNLFPSLLRYLEVSDRVRAEMTLTRIFHRVEVHRGSESGKMLLLQRLNLSRGVPRCKQSVARNGLILEL